MRRIFLLAFTAILCWSPAAGQGDQEIESAAQRALAAYSLPIQPSVRNARITLTGHVNLCRDRLLATQMIRRIHGVKSIDDRIEVLSPQVPDAQLKAQIDRIIADRIHRLGGFGFGSITAHLKDGVVTLTGTAAIKLAEPAIAAVSALSGVRNLIDHVGRVPAYDAVWRSNSPAATPLQFQKESSE